MTNKQSLEHQRALVKQERAVDYGDLWEAILATGQAFQEAGIPFPDTHIRRAQDALLRSGRISTGDLSDDEIAEIATTGNARVWAPDMGQVFSGETVIASNGDTYICTTTHQAQALYEPGTEGGRNLFRIIRQEPESGYLDFVWGEHVPYGHVRRDPIDGNLYTPIHKEGVTLYEPHYPHLVPSQYVIYEEAGGDSDEEKPDGKTPQTAVPWESAPDGYTFNVGTFFSDGGVVYEVLRQFNKQSDYRPPALTGNFYEEATA